MSARSDIGLVRPVNEDRLWTEQMNDQAAIAIIADGLGGHAAGDVASAVAVNTFREAIEATSFVNMAMEERQLLMQYAIDRSNDAIYLLASGDEEYKQMGTTIVSVLICGNDVLIGHVGDSRCYKLNVKGQLELLTVDHTYVNELSKQIPMSEEQKAKHEKRNVLARAVGTDQRVVTDLTTITWQEGEVIMLCSDGLTRMLSDEEIVNVMNAHREADDMVEALVDAAIAAGGRDNVTVVVCTHSSEKTTENAQRGDDKR